MTPQPHLNCLRHEALPVLGVISPCGELLTSRKSSHGERVSGLAADGALLSATCQDLHKGEEEIIVGFTVLLNE